MLRITHSLIVLFIIMMPMCLAYDISLPGCDTARIGINSVEPDIVYSSQCERVSERIITCRCDENVLRLYSHNEDIEHNLVIQYEDSGVTKTKQFANVKLGREPVNTEVANVVLRIIAGFVFVPLVLLIIIMLMYFTKRKKEDENEEA